MIKIEENKSIREFNTIGVSAKTFKYCKISDIKSLLYILKSNSLPLKILGGGSNILWTNDFLGLTLHINIKGIFIENETDSHVIVNINAGENWHDFVLWSLKNGYGGIENLALIPGNVGAAPIQNIGAYGVELQEVFIECSAIDIKTLKTKIFSAKDCEFGYRDSVFKNRQKNNYIITSIKIKLTKNGFHKLNIEYGDIKNFISDDNVNPAKIAEAVIRIRNSKLPNPKKLGNCGSFFKNPIIDEVLFKKLNKKFTKIPNYPFDGKYKIPAAWLIEKLKYKGYRKGNVGVHKDQALIIVNYGNSSGREILELSDQIKNDVSKTFGIKLETEVNIW
tara:strand:- start:118 stop:1122 length:1005 start_codon:yes stop_codon:yes gene_type:complete